MNLSSSQGVSGTEREGRWIVRFRPNPRASLRLFCFPYAGVGASTYFPWVRAIHPGIELIAVQPPGRESRIHEAPFDRLRNIACDAARFIRPYLDRPYAFFGHSLGALTCYETANCLRRGNVPSPARLFLSARRAPCLRDPMPGIHKLPDLEFIEEVCRRWNGIPPAILRESELLDVLLPTLRADVEALETYSYEREEPLECPFSVFAGEDDKCVCGNDLLAWREHTKGDVRLRLIPGGHFFIRSAQSEVLDAVMEDLFPLLENEGEQRKC